MGPSVPAPLETIIAVHFSDPSVQGKRRDLSIATGAAAASPKRVADARSAVANFMTLSCFFSCCCLGLAVFADDRSTQNEKYTVEEVWDYRCVGGPTVCVRLLFVWLGERQPLLCLMSSLSSSPPLSGHLLSSLSPLQPSFSFQRRMIICWFG
jgi:hypothetical protein